MKTTSKLLTVLFLSLTVLALALGSLGLEVIQAAPNFIRTSVDGVWGMRPSAYVLTGTQTLTPTTSEYNLAPPTTLTLTLSATDAQPGDRLRLVSNVATNTVVLTTNTNMSANKTLNTGDVVEFELVGSSWVEAYAIDGNDAVSSGAINATSIVNTGTSDLQGNVSDSAGDFTIADNADVTGTFNYGADNLYPLGFATSGFQIVCGEQTITGTAAIAVSGLTTVTTAIATLATDPGAAAGNPFIVSIDDPTTSTLTINVWQDDATAGATGALVHYCAIGNQ